LFIALILGDIHIGTVGMEWAFEAMGQGTVDLNWAKEHHSRSNKRRAPDASRKVDRLRRRQNDLVGVNV
jgi:cytochrome b subunit of formate dehydrogenase